MWDNIMFPIVAIIPLSALCAVPCFYLAGSRGTLISSNHSIYIAIFAYILNRTYFLPICSPSPNEGEGAGGEVMKTRSNKKNKVNVITLGCSKNIYDSEVLMGQLRANDIVVSHEDDNSDAPVVIINTCGFIDNAKQESINTILEWAEAKEKGLVEKVYVTGCLSRTLQARA